MMKKTIKIVVAGLLAGILIYAIRSVRDENKS